MVRCLIDADFPERINPISGDPASMSLRKVKRGLAHPRNLLLYLLVGKDEYYFIRSSAAHTCEDGSSDLPFSSQMIKRTDIHEHLVTLFMLTRELGLKTVVELGTRSGESTIPLLFAAKEIGGSVFSFDIEDCPAAKKLVSENGLSSYWQFTQTDDLTVDWQKPVDHLFIDTSHTYDQTIRELRKFEPFVRDGGVITMHDNVSCPDVRRATSDYLKGRSDLRRYEYLNNNGLTVVFKHSTTRG